MQYTTLAGFVNDQWKLHRLTLMLGAASSTSVLGRPSRQRSCHIFSRLYNSSALGAAAESRPILVSRHSQTSSVSNSVNSPAMVYFTPCRVAWDISAVAIPCCTRLGHLSHEEEFAPYALAPRRAGYKKTYIAQGLTLAQVDSQSPIAPLTSQRTRYRRPYGAAGLLRYNGTISQRINWRFLKNSLVEVAYVGSNTQTKAASTRAARDTTKLPTST